MNCTPGATEALASAGSELPAPGPALPWADGSPYMVARLLNMSAGLEVPAGCCIWDAEVPAAPTAPLCSISRFACCICVQGRALSQPDSMLCWTCKKAAAHHELRQEGKGKLLGCFAAAKAHEAQLFWYPSSSCEKLLVQARLGMPREPAVGLSTRWILSVILAIMGGNQ